MQFIKLFESFSDIKINTISSPHSVSVYCMVDNRRSVIDASELYDGNWEINRAFIQDNMRSNGLGSKMLQRAISEILNNNPKSICVTPGGYGSDVEELYRFYGKNGFRMDDDHYGLMYYNGLSKPGF